MQALSHPAYDLDVAESPSAVDDNDETETTPGGLDAVSRSALADALATIGDRWTLLVVAALLDGPRRFGDLQEEVGGSRPTSSPSACDNSSATRWWSRGRTPSGRPGSCTS